MTTQMEKMKADALTLKAEERAQLAHELIVSLEEEIDSNINESRENEIQKRRQEFPKKLITYLNTLGQAEKDEKIRLFQSLVEKARTNNFQSPRFWAMRQILSGRSKEQIERNIQKRIKVKETKLTAKEQKAQDKRN